MTGPEDIRKLAALARIGVEDAALSQFAKEIDGILAYVGQLESLQTAAISRVKPPLRNVFREDGAPEESGMHTKKLTAQFPRRNGDALSVRQIISHD